MPAAAVIHEWRALFIISARIVYEDDSLVWQFYLIKLRWIMILLMTVVYVNEWLNTFN